MQLKIEIPGFTLDDTTPGELATAVANLIESGIELPSGIIYANDVRVEVIEETDEFPAPGPVGLDAGNSPSLSSVK